MAVIKVGDFLEKQLKMGCDEAIEYVKNNVKTYDNLELSYNRIFTPGEVINVDAGRFKGRDVCNVMVQIDSDTINSTVEVDLEEVRDDLIEVKHMPSGEEDTIIITIEE